MAKKKTARRRITTAQARAAHEVLLRVLAEELPKQGRNGLLAKIRERGVRGERVAGRLWSQYQAEGGKEGTGKPFVEWLKANWPAILSLLLSLFA